MRLLIDLQAAQSESRFRGIGRQSRSLAKAILTRSSGHDISILLNGSLRQNIEELRAEFASLLPRDHVLTFRIPGSVAEQAPENLWRTRSAEFLREAFIARHQPDILHISSIFEGFLDDAVTSIGMLEAPHATSATLHDLIPLFNRQTYLADEGPRRHYLRRAQALKRADLLLAVSESARGEAIDFLNVGSERVVVIQCGVEEHFRQLHLSPAEADLLRMRYGLRKRFILYVGAVDPRKNVSLLLHAFSTLSPEIRSMHCLAFAGALADEERRRVRAIAARYGIQVGELIFCEQVPEHDLVQLYNCCELFVFPSKHEGFGLPVLEAMACGAPTLAANSTSLPEVVGRSDLLFDPDKSADLVAKMQAALSDTGFRQAMRSWGLKRASEFSWDEGARRALHAFETLHNRRNWQPQPRRAVSLARRQSLAFLSPLPRDRSGISEYSARLLPELARYYEIECIINYTIVTDEWVKANYALRDVAWFERNAARYDRILYSIGNSHFHSHMLGLLERFPGVVLLHDFFLSDLIDWMSSSGLLPPDEFLRQLYMTHGMTGLLAARDEGHLRAVERFACNDIVFRNASGVIVHSKYAVDRARELFGNRVADELVVIPQLHAGVGTSDREAARDRLGIGTDDFLVCSFGLITRRKLSRRLFDAWTASSLHHQTDAVLVFVGGIADTSYGDDLESAVRAQGGASRVAVTGYVSSQLYRDYLSAADLAVQLRTESRGETSAAILDCLTTGVPVIINAHGPAAEIPDDAVCKLPDDFALTELPQRIEFFRANRGAAQALGQRGRMYVMQHHDPARIGEAFHTAIEGFARKSAVAQQRALLSALSDFNAPVSPTKNDEVQLAIAIGRNSGRTGLRQILCDVTVLAEQDAKTGIQRVVRAILIALLQSPPRDFRVEPIRIKDGGYLYARHFAEHAFEIRAAVLPDAPVDYADGDVYLAIDWVPDRLPQVRKWLEGFRDAGGKIIFVVYDLLPLLMPQYFPDFMAEVTQRWFEAAISVADQFVCISRTVAHDVERFALALGEQRKSAVGINFFHIGSDLAASLPTRGLPADADEILSATRARKSFLMVGTVEPRKKHRQVVQGFDALWKQGADICLVIVGKRGWMADGVAELINQSRQRGKCLFWLQNISDEMLDKLYTNASALIAASMGEGFGLPLIEAAKHKVPLIARDIPVFREVAGTHAFYFDGDEPEDVSKAILDWLKLEKGVGTPRSDTMPHQSWKEATEQMLQAIFGDQPYKRVTFGTKE